MKRQITTAITRYPVLATWLIVLMCVAAFVIPRAIGQRTTEGIVSTLPTDSSSKIYSLTKQGNGANRAAFGVPLQGTCAIPVLPTDGSTSANARAPSTRYANSRAVYLIRASELAANGFLPGTPITTVGWTYTAQAGPSGAAPLK